jgi:hypothetical protein
MLISHHIITVRINNDMGAEFAAMQFYANSEEHSASSVIDVDQVPTNAVHRLAAECYHNP